MADNEWEFEDSRHADVSAALADLEAEYPPDDPHYPGDMSDPNAAPPKPAEPEAWACSACAMTSDDVERLDLDGVTYDASLRLCSRCQRNITNVTGALIEDIISLRALADADLIKRVAGIEERLNLDESVVPVTIDEVVREQRKQSARAAYEEGVSLVIRLFAHRDKLLEDKVLDMVAMRTSEVNAVLNRQHGAIEECRAALGLDATKRISQRRRGLLGAFLGGAIGLGIALAPKPIQALRDAMKQMEELLAQVAPQLPVDPDADPRLTYAA